MSRNFDLLAEIEREREFESANGRARSASDGSTIKDTRPPEGLDPKGIELLRLVRNVFLSGKDDAPRQVVFFGVESDNGSNSICAEAGRVLALNTSKQVCIVDGDVQSKRLSRHLNLERAAAHPTKTTSIQDSCVQIGATLWFAGPDVLSDTRNSLLPMRELKQRIAQMDAAFDYLLIDGPPTGDSDDAEILCQIAEAAILVLEANRTRRVTAAKTKQLIELTGARLLGTILNNRSFPIPETLFKML